MEIEWVNRLLTLLWITSLPKAAASASIPMGRPVCGLGGECETTESPEKRCALFMAPSSIPDAGWGLYTAVDIGKGDPVGERHEVVVPILDWAKALPYRGQQRFLSWLGHIWPAEINAFYQSDPKAFPRIPRGMFPNMEGLNSASSLHWYRDGEAYSVFAPGVASMTNSHRELDNLDFVEGGFYAWEDIPAGSELFLDYGNQWHERNEHWKTASRTYQTLDDYNRMYDFSTLPTEEEKRAQLDTATSRRNWKVKRPSATERDLPEEEEEEEEKVEKEEINHVKSLEWLRANGVCVDQLSFSKAEDTVLAARALQKGQIVAPAPLLTLKREDLIIYEVDEAATKIRHAINFDLIEGLEPLRKYCYGHPESELLLLPYSPVVNSIRHSSSNPNVRIEWTKDDANLQELLKLHPIDILELPGGTLRMDFVALRDIEEGEPILLDYGSDWEQAQEEDDGDELRFQERGVPDGFFPQHWLQASTKYELAGLDEPLQPGEVRPMVWKHNGKPIMEKGAFRVGLPRGFTQYMYDYSDKLGIVDLYRELLTKDVLESDDWVVFNSTDGQQFAQRYMNTEWDFNMHYISSWSEEARRSYLKALGRAGFGVCLDAIGKLYGLDNLTCFHSSYMGVTNCDSSFTHTDVYATGEVGFNIIFPILTVEGTSPELDIQGDNPNVVVSVHYEHDTAIVLGDFGYHKTSPNDYDDIGKMRIVNGHYCAQMTPENKDMLAYIYDGDDPAPFMGQFQEPFELHWSKDGKHTLETLWQGDELLEPAKE